MNKNKKRILLILIIIIFFLHKKEYFEIDREIERKDGKVIINEKKFDSYISTLKNRLGTCEDVNIQNINLEKNLNQYKNRGFFARLFNW